MRFLLIVLLCLGCLFRLAQLDHKIYWYDETFTSLRAAGYTEAEVVQHFANSEVIRPADLQFYQQPSPERDLGSTLYSLASEDNQHPPLYYGIAHFWMRWVGDSIAIQRLLPALFSLLSFPAAYWLCQELFVKTSEFSAALPAWIMVSLLAISPFQIAYAQENRQYSLWSALTLLSTAALLRALRVQGQANWLLYGATVALSCYTFLLAGLTVFGHGLYVLLQGKLSRMRSFLGAALVGGLAFAPWVWVLGQNLNQAQTVTSWMNAEQSLPKLVTTWMNIATRVFYDRGKEPLDRLVQLIFLVLILYAFYYLVRYAARSVWLLIVTLTLASSLPLMLADLVLGGVRSTAPRFLVPTLLGLQLAVAYLFSAKLARPHPKFVTWWRGLAAVLCCISLYACWFAFQLPTWWNKTHNVENFAITELVEQSSRPLIVSDAETGDLLALSYVLPASTDLLIRPRCYTCRIDAPASLVLPGALTQIAGQYSDLFLFHPRSDQAWQQSLEQVQGLRLEPTSIRGYADRPAFWKLVPNR
ncbi:MAG: glycosyltransferase family 39 protein [Elainella sp.]